jgi:hypothetical protein
MSIVPNCLTRSLQFGVMMKGGSTPGKIDVLIEVRAFRLVQIQGKKLSANTTGGGMPARAGSAYLYQRILI